MKKALIPILLVLILDQLVKIWIKTSMSLGEEILVFDDWFRIHFTENKGMAFGLEIGGAYGKLLLSFFRIIAISVMGWYLAKIVKANEKTGLIVSVSLIFAGATGNMIDSAFYGLIFSASGYHTVAEFLPPSDTYASFLHGHVVDMFYFPILRGQYPDWLPFVGGDSFLFFRPVFNIADSAITVGVFVLLFFQKTFFPKEEVKDTDKADETIIEERSE